MQPQPNYKKDGKISGRYLVRTYLMCIVYNSDVRLKTLEK